MSLRCAPGRAARAVGHDTTVPNGAGPPPPHNPRGGGVPALRARIPHATAPAPRAPAPHQSERLIPILLTDCAFCLLSRPTPIRRLADARALPGDHGVSGGVGTAAQGRA